MNQLCSEAVALWKEASTYRNRKTIVLEASEVSSAVNVDRAQIEQVIINLLDNAAQHSPDGSEIFISGTEEDKKVHIQVKDQGTGIPPDRVERVFDPFYTTRRGGIGLGLSIVRRIVETHEGTVHLVNNDPHPGCTVEIILPVASSE